VVLRFLPAVVIFICLITLSIAENSGLTCQYRYNTTEEIEKLNVYNNATNQFVTNTIRTVTDTFGLNLYNDHDIPITVRVMFDYSVNIVGGIWSNERYDKTITIDPRPNFYTIQEGVYVPDKRSIHSGSLKLIFQDNNETYVRYEKENVTMENCSFCNGNVCLNDGAICTDAGSCGGGYCIRGKCNNNRDCYLKDCQCEDSQVQCGNQSCVPRNTVQYGQKTTCNLDAECTTTLVNQTTGICIKTFEQVQMENDAAVKAQQEKQEAEQKAANEREAAADAEQKRLEAENNKTLMSNITTIILAGFGGIILIVTLIVGTYLLYMKIKNDRVKTEVLKSIAEREEKKAKLDDIEKELVELAKTFQINKLKLEESIKIKKKERDAKLSELQDDFEMQKNEIERAKEGIERQLKIIDENWTKILVPFPHPSANNRPIIINPYLGGYYCFYHEELPLEEYPVSSLLHRWIWKQHTGDWPRRGYHIHHKDGDKYNNSIDNLEEISGEEHYEIHRRGLDQDD